LKIKSKKESSSRKKTEKGKPRLYEAMFLVDSADATADWEGVDSAIKNILERAGVEIVSMKKWDDRQLAYGINGKEKGTYILCYFKAEGKKIRGIERDVQLSERIMRVLILCAEHIAAEKKQETDNRKQKTEKSDL
jgi:small subunit ribosomal protein S6